MKRLALVVLAACGGSKQEPPAETREPAPAAAAASVAPARAVTPGEFFRRGLPTYIVGTSGDDRSDRAIAGQADLVRSLLTPGARRIADTEIALAKGPTGWPANPVVYGGEHVNALIAALGPQLPFSIRAGRLAIGDRVFEGDELALITVVPARPGDRGHPELLLFAGTGTPGIAEINAPSIVRVDAPIVVADAFGPLVTGTWEPGPEGAPRAQLGAPNRRVGWRETARDVAAIAVKLRFFDRSAPEGDAPAIARAARGIETVVRKLAPTGALSMTVYVHPDRRSKQLLTGNGGDGHAVAFARVLHVLDGDGLEALVAHEATHVIVPQVWGAAGSPLFGEGLAVWVAGQYGGTPFEGFRKLARPSGPIRELLGPKLRSLPEAVAYPLAAIIVDVAVATVGLPNVLAHLYGATTATWDDACKRAGTTAAALDQALATALAP
ncbi:MAG TPA: hypothetical protein VK932_30830 [Kofleriaceae bacterium]|nr:hypothetical protein [Kofleriaceae bacterium]